MNDPADEIASGCIAVRVRLLNRAVTRIFDDALRSLGIRVSQLNLLVAIAKEGPIAPARLVDGLQIDASTLSRNLERMRAAGWIEAVAGVDRREQPMRVTAEGRRMLAKTLPLWKSAQGEAAELLGEPVVRRIREVAGRIGAVPKD
jgi:DNA-binding MarR family transcriptional regulator